MPYIPQHDRAALFPTPIRPAATSGELNYQITVLLDRYAKEHGLSYRSINDIMGACESAKAEFYRRVAGPYEENKAVDNGDVYLCNF